MGEKMNSKSDKRYPTICNTPVIKPVPISVPIEVPEPLPIPDPLEPTEEPIIPEPSPEVIPEELPVGLYGSFIPLSKPLVGWRAWSLRGDGYLYSPFRGTRWIRSEFVANELDISSNETSNGIHGVTQPSMLFGITTPGIPILGQIAVLPWGEPPHAMISSGGTTFRARAVQILQIILPWDFETVFDTDIIGKMRNNYPDVEIVVTQRHPMVIIGPGAQICDDILIGRHVDVGYGISIGCGVRIGSDVIIWENVSIGNNVSIGQNVLIGDNVRVGDGATIYKDARVQSGSHIRPGEHIRPQ